MQLGQYLLVLGALSLGPLAGCNFDSALSTVSGGGTSSAAVTASAGSSNATGHLVATDPAKASGNSVIATSSVAGTVAVATGATQTVSVSFTSSDGRAISGFAISDTTLPEGWSGPDNFSCTTVSAGNGCVLNLTYAPAVAGSGALTLNYIFVDSAKVPRTPGGFVTIAYVATTHNNVDATASPTGQINARAGVGNQSVSVNFTSDDGNAATDLVLNTDLSNLPSGWGSTARSFSCAIVSTGSGCQLVLNYEPTEPAAGTLTLSYSYIDDSATARSAAVNIPYSTTAESNVIATVAPTGQINAVEKTGSQPVAVTFNTDDGNPASSLFMTSDLTTLPGGWSSASSNFSCTSINGGNGCQLRLDYAPTALAAGTITLNYSYDSNDGTFKTGSLNVAYAATTNDNGVGTPSPSGQINAVVGLGSQAVSVTFATDDARPATALELTSSLTALPAGWNSTASSFTCSGFGSGSGCQLHLTYAPPAAATGTLTLRYIYKNNAGQARTGSVNIAYRATTDDNVVATPSQSSLAVLTGSSTVVTVTFTTDDGNPASDLSVTSGLTSLPAGWSTSSPGFSCSAISSGAGCQLSLTYAPTSPATGTLTLGYSYTNNSGIVKAGTVTIAYTAAP
jgi:hypothetical protein